MITSKVTKRGQTTLPRRVRDALGIQPGQSLIYEVEGDRVVMHSHPGVLASFGSLKKAEGKGRVENFQKARAAARDEWAGHAEREGSDA
jgi:AbrB family looped-hinge helix DNA binding protein